MTQDPLRHYVVLKVNNEVSRVHFARDRGEAHAWAATYIADEVYGRGVRPPPFETAALPSFH